MIKFYQETNLPLEMHKVRIVQKLNLIPLEERKKALEQAGFNTFLLKNRDVFLDMLTDSGTNAMSDKQLAAMMEADDSYAGSETFFKLTAKLQEVFGTKYFLPAHQGRACEHILAKVFVKPGSFVPMNYHFTTTKSHIMLCGGEVLELFIDEALAVTSTCLFKGNLDVKKLEQVIKDKKAENIAFVRMEAGTNLIGGQPFSLANAKEVFALCKKHGILTVLDASLLADNLYFIKMREQACFDMSILEITKALISQFDIVYFSGRKLGCAKGGGICVNDDNLYLKMRELIPLYEGFLTYGGMSTREMEAMTVGLTETMDLDMISQGPKMIEFMVNELQSRGIPVVTPAGGLGCHLDASTFMAHLPKKEYQSASLVAALFLVSGCRGMERGTLSEIRDANGNDVFANMELVRLALPRRVFTLSQVKFVIDRLCWLYDHRQLIGGLRFVDEPKILRFFFGTLEPTSDWVNQLVSQFKIDFQDSL
ncbi:MAG TPA: tryptophanase [Bacilli bacterium]|nr:MAG: Tyrosine phenol-lyase [Tenericutes bacterium ADurb.BinA124]HPX83814.1 tryptophanase [Bacilli bacterium]HQC74257.1 tryptophanase [Bacilli bacterium]